MKPDYRSVRCGGEEECGLLTSLLCWHTDVTISINPGTGIPIPEKSGFLFLHDASLLLLKPGGFLCLRLCLPFPWRAVEGRGATTDYFLLFSMLPFCFSALFSYAVSFLLTPNVFLTSSDYCRFSFFILTLLLHCCKKESLIHYFALKEYNF